MHEEHNLLIINHIFNGIIGKFKHRCVSCLGSEIFILRNTQQFSQFYIL